MKLGHISLVVGALVAIAACEPSDPQSTTSSEGSAEDMRTPLVLASAQGSIDDCPDGGVALDYGIDTNGNGQLETDEISDVLYICHGRDGADGSVVELDPLFTASPASEFTAAQVATWDVAYSWGDHTGVGYLQSELDPVFSTSPAGGITAAQVSDWASAFAWGDHSSAGYLQGETDPSVAAFAKTALPDCSASGNILTSTPTGFSCVPDAVDEPAESLEEVLQTSNDAQGQVIANLSPPIASADAATKGYVDAAMAGAEPEYTLAVCCGTGCGADFPGWTCVNSPDVLSVPRGKEATLDITNGHRIFISRANVSTEMFTGLCFEDNKLCYTQLTGIYATCAASGASPPLVLPGYVCQQITSRTVIATPDAGVYRFWPSNTDMVVRLTSFFYTEPMANGIICPIATTPDQYACWK